MDNELEGKVIGDHFSSMQDSVEQLGTVAKQLSSIPKVPLSKIDPWGACKERVLIIFLARTGSTWLCELMNKTNLMGHPRESLHAQEFVREYEKGVYENLNEIMLASVEKHCTGNGIYSAKSTFHTLAPMFLLEEFPKNLNRWKIVVLTREDKVDQAISVVKLDMNRKATSFDSSSKEIVEEDYDFNQISRKLNRLMDGEKTISTFLQVYGVSHLNITYESLNEGPSQTIEKIAEFCGISVTDVEIETQFKIQRDAISTKWKDRWLKDAKVENPLFSSVAFFKR